MNRHFRQKRTPFTPAWILIAILALTIPGIVYGETVQTAVVVTAAPDYSSGAHSVISVDPPGGPRTVQNNLLPTISDIAVDAYENHFYRLERYQQDNVTKFDIDAPSTVIYQYSVLGGNETGSANPRSLIFVNSQKAYLLRYGQSTAWIVNPSATSEARFKIGELDLSAYADEDGIPEMEGGVIVNDKLFIIMSRMDRNAGFVPTNTAYAAVFDTATDTEIDTGTANGDGLKGIALSIRNATAIQYLSANNTIYIQGVGDYGDPWSGRDPDYTGGIVTLNPTTYVQGVLLDDGDADNHPYGNISGLAVISPDKGYFVGYAEWGDNTIYRFSPATGEVIGPVHDELSGISIAGMQSGAYADQNDMLWICDQTNARITILDTTDDTIDETVSTGLNPLQVAFVEKTVDDRDGGYTVAGDLWMKAVFQTPAGPVTLKKRDMGTDTTATGDTVLSSYFYADPGDFAYGSMYNPEVFVKVYISSTGWANIVFNHVTVDDVDVYSAHHYTGTAQQSGTITLETVKTDHSYTGVSVE